MLRGRDLEAKLGISREERVRWVEEGRIPAVDHYEFFMWGRMQTVTLHDAKFVATLRPLIPEWRVERKRVLAERRQLLKQVWLARRA